MNTEHKVIEVRRDDGSKFAIINTYKDEDNRRFLKINVIEDSDWLYVEDMQQLAIQLFTAIMKLQYQDDKDSLSLDK